jgi:hypothetical protein
MRKLILLALGAAAVAWYLRNEGEPATSFAPTAGAPPAEPASPGTSGMIVDDATAATAESDALTPDAVDPGDESAGATEDEGR